MTLYELNAEIEDILSAIGTVGADSPEAEPLFDELESLYENRAAKQEGYVHVIRNAETSASALRAEASQFTARAKALERIAERLKHRLQDDMARHGEQVIDAGMFTVRRQASPPAVDVHVPVEALPEAFHKVSVTADKAAIKEALQAGIPVAGAELRRGEYVRIRVK